MKLSELAFLCVKNVIYLNDASFNYEGFCAGEFDSDIDYATNINNVFSPMNEAIARLQDLNKIPYVVAEIKVGDDMIADLSNLDKRIKHIVGVAAVGTNGSYRKLAFSMFGKDKIRINSSYFTSNKIFVEYKESIPTFTKGDVVEVVINDGIKVDNNIDLFEEYGISGGMDNYIMEYVQGKLLEPLAPDLANMHITRAEAYFNNLPSVYKNFPQIATNQKYVIGE